MRYHVRFPTRLVYDIFFRWKFEVRELSSHTVCIRSHSLQNVRSWYILSSHLTGFVPYYLQFVGVLSPQYSTTRGNRDRNIPKVDVIIKGTWPRALRSRSPFQLQFTSREVPLAQKIEKISGICLQLFFLPNFEPVYYVKKPNFLEFGEGEEERMEWLERSTLSHTRENLVLQKLVIGYYTLYIPWKTE